MQALDDIDLLRQYVDGGAEAAFGEIIKRHVNKVYSVALRHTRNPLQAEEITQAVFVILAQKARSLGPRVILSGWLYQTARLTAVTFLRGEIRRTRREQEAHMQTILNENDNDPETWKQIAPLLDAAMTELNEADRHALVLRYFDGKSMREVGGALGTTEDAAKKRVKRAVEKMQNFFVKHGIDSTADAITGAISMNAVLPAPVTLAKTVATVSLAKGAAASGPTLTLIKGTLKTMAWAKIKFVALAGAGVLLATGGVTAIYVTHKETGAATLGSGGAADMTLQWVVGKKYAMRVEYNQSSETPLPDQPQPVKSDVKFTLNYDVSVVKALSNGGRQLELEFMGVTLNVLRNGIDVMNLDSTQTAADGQNPARSLVGSRLQYFTGADDKVEKIEGADELMRHLSEAEKSEEQAVFKSIFSGETLKSYVSFQGAIPDQTIKLGQRWQHDKDIYTSVGPMNANIKYTFKDWARHDGHKCAHIAVAGDLSTKNPSAASGALMTVNNSKILGDMWFDPELGMIVESSNTQTMAMKITTQARTLTSKIGVKVRLMLLGVE